MIDNMISNKELKSEAVLIDKVTVGGFDIIDIEDISSLAIEGIVEIKEFAKCHILTKAGEFFHTLKLGQNDLFDRFIYRISNDGHTFGELDLSVKDDGYHNLNCYTLDDYRTRLSAIAIFLNNKYGIKVDFGNAKFKRIEINRTFEVYFPYESYNRVLSMMMNNLCGKARFNGEIDWCKRSSPANTLDHYSKNILTYSRSSGEKGKTFKIYDKTSQLRDCFNINVCRNYIRFELSLNSFKSIKDSLGTNMINELTDEIIQSYFILFIEKNIVQTFKKHCHFRDKYLKHILKTTYQASSRTWIRNVMDQIADMESGVAIMLDISELIDVIDCIKWPNRKAKYNAKKQFIKLCDNSFKRYHRNDDLKFQEVLQKLTKQSI